MATEGLTDLPPTVLSADVGVFGSIRGDDVGGTLCANLDDLSARVNDKVITPWSLYHVIQSVGGGGLYPTEASFQKIIVDELDLIDTVLGAGVGGTGHNLYNTGELLVGDRSATLSTLGPGYDGQVLVANAAAPLGLEWDTITIKTYDYATDQDMILGADTNKLVSPAAVAFILNNAPKVNTPTATVGNLTITGTVDGIFVTSTQQLFDNGVSTLAITPAMLEPLFSSPPPIGDDTPNTGAFSSLNCQYLQVDYPPWPTMSFTYAANDEAEAKNIADKALTPANIPTVMMDPGQIGSPATSYNGFFADIVCANLTVTDSVPWPTIDVVFATDVQAEAMVDGSVALTPRNVPAIMDAPPPIGGTSANTGVFTTLACSSLSVTGTPPWPTLDLAYASNEEAVDPMVSHKGLTPANVPYVMAAPGTIGGAHASDAYFANVSAGALELANALSSGSGGTGYASYATGDILVGTATGLARLNAGSDNQVLVSDSGASTGVRWTSLGGSVPAATTAAYGTVQIATNTALTNYLNGSNTGGGGLAITVANVANALVKGTAFGNGTANATFANVVTTGTATLGTPLYPTSGGTGRSSYNDGDMLVGNALGGLSLLAAGSEGAVMRVVDGEPAWAAHENVADATTSSSGVVTLATAQETVALSSTAKVVTPAGLAALLQSPPNIGAQTAAGATFTSLSVTGSLALDAGIQVGAANGGTGIASYSAGDLLVGNAGGGLLKLGVGTYGQALMVDHNNTLSWSNTGGAQVATTTQSGIVQLATDAEAVAGTNTDKAATPANVTAVFGNPPPLGSVEACNTAVVTDITVTGTLSLTSHVLGPTIGGTGISEYSKGDLLAGDENGILEAIAAGATGNVLTTDPASATGLAWAQTAMPPLFQEVAPPIIGATGYTASVAHCYVRSLDQGSNIAINSQRLLDLGVVGLAGNGYSAGPVQSQMLPGAVDVSGQYVYGTDTYFAGFFQVGDVITVAGNGSRRIIAIASNTELTVESAFPGSSSGQSHYRGGAAPSTVYYLYAAGGPMLTNALFMSERSIAVDQKNLEDAPQGYNFGQIRQLPYSFYTAQDSSFYRIWWTKNFARPMPFMPIDATNVTTVSSIVALEMLPVTTVMVDLRASLATTAAGGCTLTVGDYNGYSFDDMVVLDGADKMIVGSRVPVTNRAFRAHVSDIDNSTLQLWVAGYWVMDNCDLYYLL
jgi:hypothetical protein